MTARSIPSASPTPIAPRRFITLCSPTSGDAISRLPARRLHVHVNAVHAPSGTAADGSSAPGRRPKVRTGTASPAVIDAPDGSSALITAVRRALAPAASRRNSRALASAVGVERAVKIEVVLGQVREDGHVELDAVRAVEGERVRRDLHGRRPATPRLDHAREEGLQLERFGRRLARREPLVADPVLDRADQSGRAGPGRARARRRGATSSSCRSCR